MQSLRCSQEYLFHRTSARKQLHEDTWERYLGRVPTTATALVVRDYERLAVGRPMVSHEPYHGGMYGEEEDERPTMGTIWIWRQVRSYTSNFVIHCYMMH